MSQSSDLFRLQKIDSQYEQSITRIKEIDQIITADQTVKEGLAKLDAAKQQLATAQELLSRAEAAVHNQTIKIELNQASLYSGKITNPKELQDLQNEAVSLKKHLVELEDNQLDAMLNLETAEKLHQEVQDRMAVITARTHENQAALIGEKENLEKLKTRLESEREAAAHSLTNEIMLIFERLKKQKHGLAVVTVTDHTCDACGHTLTPGEWQAARSPHQLCFCPSCGRILYAG